MYFKFINLEITTICTQCVPGESGQSASYENTLENLEKPSFRRGGRNSYFFYNERFDFFFLTTSSL